MVDAGWLPDFPDPRVFRDAASAPDPLRTWYALAGASLDAASAATSAASDDALKHALTASLEHDPALVERAIEAAPSPFVSRHLWRVVDEIWRHVAHDEALHVTAFAIPLVIVAGSNAPDATDVTLPGVLANVQGVVEVMREGAALRGNQAFTLSAALVSASALAIRRWPAWQCMRALDTRQARVDDASLAPMPLTISSRSEGVHLRFLIGSALAARAVDLLDDSTTGRWGAAVTRELVRQLAHPDVSVLPLLRAPQRPFSARYDGFVAQREISAQLFASNAIRKLRASTGEPGAVISSDRAQDAPGGGELRLSLSSTFEERDAEGFRCPIDPIEPVAIPLRMLLDLLRDCRVDDVHVVAGIHPDTRAGSALRLFFRPDTIPERASLQ